MVKLRQFKNTGLLKLKKVSKNKIAVTYGLALYEAAAETNSLEKVREDVAGLLKIIHEDSTIMDALANPMWSEKDKRETLAEIAVKLKWNPDTLRCLGIVIENRRLKELPLILEQFGHIYYQKKNLAEVEVSSVKALSAAQQKRLKTNLETMIGRNAVITYKIEPELIGGLKIIYGSNLIDNSVASKLNRLENMMKGD